jgi:hypothetical protein
VAPLCFSAMMWSISKRRRFAILPPHFAAILPFVLAFGRRAQGRAALGARRLRPGLPDPRLSKTIDPVHGEEPVAQDWFAVIRPAGIGQREGSPP